MKNFIFTLIFITLFTNCSIKLSENQKNSLKNELTEIVKTDQIAASRWEEKWAKYRDSVFTNNKIRVEKMFNDFGFLGFNKVGEEGSKNFWLIVQHSDKFPDFQRRILTEMEKQVKRENANANDYALLFDRVQVNAGQKQKFGTQVSYEVETTGKAFPKIGLIDSLKVDI